MAKSRDFTAGNPTTLMLKFAWPLILSMVLQNLYNTMDMIIVGRYLGNDALAAVGTTASISMLVLMLISGATMGMSVVVSQFYGAKDEIRVKKAICTSFYLITALSLVFSIIGAVFTMDFLRVMNVPDNIIGDAAVYLRIIFLGSITTALYNMASFIMRSLGDSLTPMITLIISSVLNVGLNILFVAAFGLGVPGVAYATVIATALSAVVCWVILWRKMPIIHPTRETLKPDFEVIKLVVRIGVPSALMSSSMALGNVIIQTVVNGFGPTVMAAYSAATKIEALVAYAPGGLTQGMQVFTGQNVGARQYERVRQGFRSSMKLIVGFSACTLLALVLLGRPLMTIFTSDGGEMVEIGRTYLMISGLGSILCGILFLCRSTLTGAGDAMAAIYISVIELAGRIIGSFVLARYFGYAGAFIGTVTGWLGGAAFGYIRYARGGWTAKGLVKAAETAG
ncbi:MAG: MATE family efflux transporter [Clostridiales bacterium]|jgi:putative MATE family efflux protein|nr:MATE family efflux transporter [Clostridiales bacterium]